MTHQNTPPHESLFNMVFKNILFSLFHETPKYGQLSSHSYIGETGREFGQRLGEEKEADNKVTKSTQSASE